jgi:hypothetical protein
VNYRFYYILLGILTISTLPIGGCDLFEEEPVPSYVYIDTIFLNTKTGQGTNRHSATDAWVSVGPDLVGAFPLPALIPVLETGEQEVTVFGGILQNGIGATRDVYPFYTRYTVAKDLKPGGVDTIRPTVEYADDLVFLTMEDFEASNIISDDLDGNNNTKVIRSDSLALVYEGTRSGHIVLSGTDNYIEVGTNLFYEFPTTPERVYLELHYKNDVTFEVGIAGKSNNYFERFYKVGVIPSTEWKKIYVDFSNDVTSMITNSAEEFQIVFRALHAGDAPANIYLDNIKLIYR